MSAANECFALRRCRRAQPDDVLRHGTYEIVDDMLAGGDLNRRRDTAGDRVLAGV